MSEQAADNGQPAEGLNPTFIVNLDCVPPASNNQPDGDGSSVDSLFSSGEQACRARRNKKQRQLGLHVQHRVREARLCNGCVRRLAPAAARHRSRILWILQLAKHGIHLASLLISCGLLLLLMAVWDMKNKASHADAAMLLNVSPEAQSSGNDTSG